MRTLNPKLHLYDCPPSAVDGGTGVNARVLVVNVREHQEAHARAEAAHEGSRRGHDGSVILIPLHCHWVVATSHSAGNLKQLTLLHFRREVNGQDLWSSCSQTLNVLQQTTEGISLVTLQ